MARLDALVAEGGRDWLAMLGIGTPDGIEWLTVAALVFGAIWLYISLYTYAPVYRRAAFRLAGDRSDPRVYGSVTDRSDDVLPTIDVLVPAYDEDETLVHTIAALRAANYPADKLTVSVVVEAADRTTRTALAALRDVYDFEQIVIPPDYPGAHNKPRALTYGFERTDSDIVGIIDAEDIVASDLFRQVIRALIETDHDYVQGRLDMANEDDGLLNTLFRGEYGLQYGTIIPSYFAVGYPVPLGGTTNFATRETLEAIAAERVDRFGSPWTAAERDQLAAAGYRGVTPWDPRNVTEDFELGLLLWETGREIAMLTAVTREESPLGLNEWLKQRTRWQKGKLFTLAQRLRHPPAGIRQKLHVYTQSATPHLGLLNTTGVILIALYATFIGFNASPIVTVVLLMGLALALQQLVIHAAGYWLVTDRRGAIRVGRTLLNAAGVPLYWVLQWAADIRAFMQLAVGDFEWEKTNHLGRHINTDDVAVSAGNLSFVVSAVADGWTWTLNREDTVVASAAARYDSLDQATNGVARFIDAVEVAAGAEATFEVGIDSGAWRWRLMIAGSEQASAAESLTCIDAAIESVGRTKTAAGSATVSPSSTRLEPVKSADTEVAVAVR